MKYYKEYIYYTFIVDSLIFILIVYYPGDCVLWRNLLDGLVLLTPSRIVVPRFLLFSNAHGLKSRFVRSGHADYLLFTREIGEEEFGDEKLSEIDRGKELLKQEGQRKTQSTANSYVDSNLCYLCGSYRCAIGRDPSSRTNAEDPRKQTMLRQRGSSTLLEILGVSSNEAVAEMIAVEMGIWEELKRNFHIERREGERIYLSTFGNKLEGTCLSHLIPIEQERDVIVESQASQSPRNVPQKPIQNERLGLVRWSGNWRGFFSLCCVFPFREAVDDRALSQMLQIPLVHYPIVFHIFNIIVLIFN
jgi:hypothetical protein